MVMREQEGAAKSAVGVGGGRGHPKGKPLSPPSRIVWHKAVQRTREHAISMHTRRLIVGSLVVCRFGTT